MRGAFTIAEVPLGGPGACQKVNEEFCEKLLTFIIIDDILYTPKRKGEIKKWNLIGAT